MCCPNEEAVMLSELSGIISEVLKRRGRDPRNCHVAATLAPPDGAVIVLECSEAEILGELESAALAALGEVAVRIRAILLPDPAGNTPEVMVVRTTVADVRRRPDPGSELVSQVILGRAVQPLKEAAGWFLVRCDDGYLGWIHGRDLLQVSRPDLDDFMKQVRDRVSVLKTSIFAEAGTASALLAEALLGTSVLAQPGGERGWRAVRLPDGRSGFIPARHLEPVPRGKRISRAALSATGLKLLGIPYLWGGTSTRGFDCSGLVQTIYRLHGRLLPRDSDLQAEFGRRKRSGNVGALRTGNLLFFGKPGDRLHHVGMYLWDGLFLHASGQVRVGSLAADHPLYEPILATEWRCTNDPVFIR
jgi:hypothetical protein